MDETVETNTYIPTKNLNEDVRRAVIPGFRKTIAFSLVTFFLCLVVFYSFKQLPQLSIYFIIAVFITGSAIFISELWIVYIFLNSQYIADEKLSAISGPSPANANLIKHIEKKINTSILFTGDNIKTPLPSFNEIKIENLNIYTYNTTKYFSLLTMDGLPDLEVLFMTIIVITAIACTKTLMAIKNKKEFVFVVKLFKETYFVLNKMPCLYFHSTIIFVFLVLIWVYYSFIVIFLLTINKPIIDKRGFADFVIDDFNLVLILIAIIFCFCVWFWHFIANCGVYILAHVVFTYIFYCKNCKGNKYLLTFKPIIDLIKYHLGTLALASTAIIFCEFNKSFFGYIKEKLESFRKGKTKFVDLCTDKLEHCSTNVNSTVIICAALYGHNFSNSVKLSHDLLSKKSQSLIELNDSIILFAYLLKCSFFVFSMVVLFCYYHLLLLPHRLPLEFPVMPWYISMISINLAQCFFSIYGTVLSTLIICCCDNLKKNVSDEFYISKDFQNLISIFSSQKPAIKYKNQIVPLKDNDEDAVGFTKTNKDLARSKSNSL